MLLPFFSILFAFVFIRLNARMWFLWIRNRNDSHLQCKNQITKSDCSWSSTIRLLDYKHGLAQTKIVHRMEYQMPIQPVRNEFGVFLTRHRHHYFITRHNNRSKSNEATRKNFYTSNRPNQMLNENILFIHVSVAVSILFSFCVSLVLE